MKEILGCIRRADQDYHMIESGDRVAVGVSGGKDSVLLLYALSLYRRFSPHPFELEALTLTTGLEPFDLQPIRALCEKIDVPYTVRETEIGRIVFEERHEKNPCALCSKMRRGALNDLCNERGLNKLALGHHYDDAVETFLMSLIYEGRISCFQPVTHLDRTGITQIRPMLYIHEKTVDAFARRMELPVLENRCPVDKHTKREEVKELIFNLVKEYPDLKERIFGAMQRYPLEAWEPHGRYKRPREQD